MKAKIGREISPVNGTMISLDDLRRALLLNALEIDPENTETDIDESPEFVIGFLTGWRYAMLCIEEVLSKDVGAEATLDLTDAFDLGNM